MLLGEYSLIVGRLVTQKRFKMDEDVGLRSFPERVAVTDEGRHYDIHYYCIYDS